MEIGTISNAEYEEIFARDRAIRENDGEFEIRSIEDTMSFCTVEGSEDMISVVDEVRTKSELMTDRKRIVQRNPGCLDRLGKIISRILPDSPDSDSGNSEFMTIGSQTLPDLVLLV